MATKKKHNYYKKRKSTKLSPYAVFHFANIGYYWRDKLTGKEIDKRVMFEQYGQYPKILDKLTKNKHPDYSREVKFGY
jgi:hypothetical protein